MTAKESYGDGTLLPGLPDELVLTNVITRLPWFARPVCRAVSKEWRASIDASVTQSELLFRSRGHLLPLLQSRVLFCTFDVRAFIAKDCHGLPEGQPSGYHRFQWEDQTYQICKRQWRELPSLQDFLPQPPVSVALMATCGIVYAWTSVKPQSFVLRMDMAGGDWTWKELPVSRPAVDLPVAFNGMMYVPCGSREEKSAAGEEKEMEHGTTTDHSGPIKTWNRDSLEVLRSKVSTPNNGGEELCSFVEHELLAEPKLEILVYDADKDLWKTKEMIPIPECRWSEISDVKLVNGDCFEPAADTGINTVWIDNEGGVLSWFNSSLHETWIEFDYNTHLDGMCMEYLQFIHGGLYGMFIEMKDDEDEEEEEAASSQAGDGGDQQDPSLVKRTIMKGRMVLEQNEVHWETVVDVGCFRESYYLQPAVVSPVNDYTLMA